MILSYILHGHIPYYTSNPPHPDSLLHTKLERSPCLLRPDLDDLTCHFGASSLSYSTQALPINVLLDTLLRPQGEVDDLAETTNLQWKCKPHRAVPHLVVGDAPSPGGLWAMDDPVHMSWEIGTLSYAGMLSLPGYTFADHHRQTTGKELAPFTRPSRRALADYLRAYPREAGIADSFRDHTTVTGIHRIPGGFYIPSHRIRCKHLVLASGIFSHLIQPPPILAPLFNLPQQESSSSEYPLLVVGSGFTAADAIICVPSGRRILHSFLWNPDERPSPLKSCHQQAYPEYAGIYRLMKRAALTWSSASSSPRPKTRRLASTPFLQSRNWDEIYEGLPNCTIKNVQLQDDHAVVTFVLEDGTEIVRPVHGLVYGVGRRGSLDYLEPSLRDEVLKDAAVASDGYDKTEAGMLSAKSLRNKVMDDLEVAPDVFVIGSLTGDSLIRYAYGGCVYAAYSLMMSASGSCTSSGVCTPSRQPAGMPMGGRHALLSGVDGHAAVNCREECPQSSPQGIRPSSWWNSIWRLLF